MHRFGLIALATAFLVSCGQGDVALTPAPAQPGDEGYDRSEWAFHGGTPYEQRFSPLAQITTDNVSELGLAWSHDFGVSRGIEVTPIVVDGVMYVTSTWNIVTALDARTGEQLWRVDPKVDRAKAKDLCCDAVNRGVAVEDGKVVLGTIDGRLIALDAVTGETVWDVVTVDQSQAYTITGAPRIVKGMVMIGNGGGEFGVRGYMSAYDLQTGEMKWRFYTVPGNPADGFESAIMEEAAKTWTGEWWKYGGGGTVWDSMAYDPELDLLYIGVGNGSPWNQHIRSPEGGDNLFLSSIVALKPDTGEYVWHYQTTPGETWDYTATQHMILADLEIEGELRQVIMQAPKNGFFYVLDRGTGEFISAENIVKTTWAKSIDPETGRPVEAKNARWGDSDKMIFTLPGSLGAHNWHPMAFHPQTGLVYIPAQEVPAYYVNDEDFEYHRDGWNTGQDFAAEAVPTSKLKLKFMRGMLKGNLIAWDPVRQKEAWSFKHNGPWNGGIVATAGGLVFQGSADAHFNAFDAASGEKLWSFFSQTGIVAAPVSYEIDGEQYIAVAAGWGGAYTLVIGGAFPTNSTNGVGRVLVFKLGADGQLPELPVPDAVLPEPPPSTASKRLIKQGMLAYNETCSVCHGIHAVSSGLVPSLRHSYLLGEKEMWENVVLHGERESFGMPGFGNRLNVQESEAIRAYVISEANSSRDDRFYQSMVKD
jgi:quinohemoprotein ethanol dehydrogenase